MWMECHYHVTAIICYKTKHVKRERTNSFWGYCGMQDRFRLRGAAGSLELVSKELNHLAAILHVYAGGLNFMK